MEVKPRFTSEARQAALRARNERHRIAMETFGHPEVFVMRGTPPTDGFIWEIRRFGGVTIVRSARSYPTAFLARKVAAAALSKLLAQQEFGHVSGTVEKASNAFNRRGEDAGLRVSPQIS